MTKINDYNENFVQKEIISLIIISQKIKLSKQPEKIVTNNYNK